MRTVVIGLILFCGASMYAASRDAWPEMVDPEKGRCFRAKELQQKKLWLSDHGYFRSQKSHLPARDYKGFYKDGACPDMIFGTVSAPDGRFYDVFAPSRAQVLKLMEILQKDVEEHLLYQMSRTYVMERTGEEKLSNVVGLYPPNTAFGLGRKTPYVKIPCISQDVSSSDCVEILDHAHTPSRCIVFSDVFDVGRTEFQLAAKFLDEAFPCRVDVVCADVLVLFAAVYLQNGRQEEATVRLDGQDYSLGLMEFRGSVSDRLMMHAKLYVMDDYLSESEDSSFYAWAMSWLMPPRTQKEMILSLSKENRGPALRHIFEKDSGLEKMAYDRYLSYIEPYLLYKVSVQDFITEGWMDKETADDMRIVMPTASLSPEEGLDLSAPLRYLFNHKGIEHFLEPILYLPEDALVLDAPAGHGKVLQEKTGFLNLHEAPVLTLELCEGGHYCIVNDWLQLCQGRQEWSKDETIGVVLYEPDARTLDRTKYPTLWCDVMDGIAKDLKENGYDFVFFYLGDGGTFCNYPVVISAPQAYQSACKKSPSCHKFVDETVRVVWSGSDWLQKMEVYSSHRQNV